MQIHCSGKIDLIQKSRDSLRVKQILLCSVLSNQCLKELKILYFSIYYLLSHHKRLMNLYTFFTT